MINLSLKHRAAVAGVKGNNTVQLDPFGRDYLRLVLHVCKYVDGYIDHYGGPAALKVEVEAEDKLPIERLQDELAELNVTIPSEDANRAAYLKAVLRAIDCTLRMQAGEHFDYLEEVNRLYDIRPGLVDEATFTAAHNELDTLLEGSGSIVARVAARRERYAIPNDRLLDILEVAKRETGKRTAALVDLVEGDSVELTLVKNKPWGAYNWYKGNAHSLIEFNTDLPVMAYAVADLFAHEAYPGHHTEAQLKEQYLYNARGHVEMVTMALNSPAAVIAEGIATTALEVIFPDNTQYAWMSEMIFPVAGVEGETPDALKRIDNALNSLQHAHNNAAIRFHNGKMTQEQCIDYIMTYALYDRDRAERSFRFITHPLFRSYIFTYTEGYKLIDEAAKKGDKRDLFIDLLTSHILPSQLI